MLVGDDSAFGNLTAREVYDGIADKPNDAKVEVVESWEKITWRRFCKNKVAFWSMVLLLGIVLMAVLAPVIAPFNPNTTVGDFDAAPSAAHLLGTDDVGMDILSRLIYGSRVSLIVGVGSVFIYALIGITLGLLSGYLGGTVDGVIMRITEVFMLLIE